MTTYLKVKQIICEKLMCMTTTWISSMKDNLILYHPPASNLRLFTFLLISMYNALHNVWYKHIICFYQTFNL